MPVPSGLSAFFQAQQNFNQSVAQAGQFAEAMARLRLAEEQFKQRHEFDKEVFKAQQQRYEGELALRDTQLKLAQAQMEQLQFRTEQEKAGQAAYTEFQETTFGPYMAALASGDEEAASFLAFRMDTKFATLPAGAQRMFLETEEARLRLKMYPQVAASQIAERLAKARGTATAPILAERVGAQTKLATELLTVIAGFDIKQRAEEHERQQNKIQEQVSILRTHFNQRVAKHNIVGLSGVAAQLAAQTGAMGITQVQDVLNNLRAAKQSASGTAQNDLSAFEGQMTALYEDMKVENNSWNATVQQQEFAKQLSIKLAGQLFPLSGELAQNDQTVAKLTQQVAQYGRIFKKVQQTEAFRKYERTPGRTKDPALRAAVVAELQADPLLQGRDKTALREAIMDAIDDVVSYAVRTAEKADTGTTTTETTEQPRMYVKD